MQNLNLQTPLHFACIENSLEIAKYLIKAGAKIDTKDKHGNTPLWNAVFKWYSEYKLPGDRSSIIKFLIENGANKDSLSIYNHSPYSFAKEVNNIELIALLEGK